MKHLIVEATYIYTYPPIFAIRRETGQIEHYFWSNYPYAQNLRDLGPLSSSLICSSICYANNTIQEITQAAYQSSSNLRPLRNRPRIEEVTYMDTIPPTIAIRWSNGTTDFHPWTTYPYQQNLENFTPWFSYPQHSFATSEPLFTTPSEKVVYAPTSSEATKRALSPLIYSSFFATPPEEVVYSSLDKGRIHDALLDPFDRVMKASDEISEEIMQHNIRNYQPNPKQSPPYVSVVQALEIAALKIHYYSEVGLVYVSRYKDTATTAKEGNSAKTEIEWSNKI